MKVLIFVLVNIDICLFGTENQPFQYKTVLMILKQSSLFCVWKSFFYYKASSFSLFRFHGH